MQFSSWRNLPRNMGRNDDLPVMRHGSFEFEGHQDTTFHYNLLTIIAIQSTFR